MATPPWRPNRPPTPRYHRPEPHPKSPETLPPATEETTTVRIDVPAAHGSHSTRAFVVKGVRWPQQSVVWSWPEGPATEAAGEEPHMGRRGSQGEPSGSPKERPAGRVGPTDAEYGAIHPEGGNTPGGAGGEGTVGVARARGQPSTPSAAATLDKCIE
uniref:Translation initiation factor IF-2-like n=1 Tax=Drosophila rhopaloa TaxID=1041015 RepID=A0A6P4E6V6_DRORH